MWAVANHVGDVVVKTVCTFRSQYSQTEGHFGKFKQVMDVFLISVAYHRPSQCWWTHRRRGAAEWFHCRHDGPTTEGGIYPPEQENK